MNNKITKIMAISFLLSYEAIASGVNPALSADFHNKSQKEKKLNALRSYHRQFEKRGTKRLEEEAELEKEGLNAFIEYLGEEDFANKNGKPLQFKDLAPIYQTFKTFQNMFQNFSNDEKSAMIQSRENFIAPARAFPEYFGNVLNAIEALKNPRAQAPAALAKHQEKLNQYAKFVNTIHSLMERERIRPKNMPELKLFQSENPEFVNAYHQIAKNLSLSDISQLFMNKNLFQMKDFFYNWAPLPAKIQDQFSWEKRDHSNAYANKMLNTVLNRKFKNSDDQILSNEEVLKDFAKQFYSLTSESAKNHNLFKYWKNQKKENFCKIVKNMEEKIKAPYNWLSKAASKIQQSFRK